MKKIFRPNNFLIENRFFWASVAVIAVISHLWLRIWHLQIYKGEYYRRVSENNRIRKIEIPAPRGVIYDAYGKVVLGNTPSSDLVMVPQYVKEMDKTFVILSRLLHEPVSSFERRYKAVGRRPKFMPVTLQRNLSQHEISIIENNRIFLPGVEVRTTARREYSDIVSPHMTGYLGEISTQMLDELNASNPSNLDVHPIKVEPMNSGTYRKFLRCLVRALS